MFTCGDKADYLVPSTTTLQRREEVGIIPVAYNTLARRGDVRDCSAERVYRQGEVKATEGQKLLRAAKATRFNRLGMIFKA